MINDILIDSNLLLDELSKELEKAINSAKHPWHLMHVSTIDSSGMPNSRIMVLREFCLKNSRIVTNADYRSPKANELLQNPNSCILFYDPNNKIQLRIKAKALVHYQDQVALSRWQNLKKFSKRCYYADFAPSSELNETIKDSFSSDGYNNFSVIFFTYYKIEILKLCHTGHKRRLLELENHFITKDCILAP